MDLICGEPLAAAVVAAFDSSNVAATTTTSPAVAATQQSTNISCVRGKTTKKFLELAQSAQPATRRDNRPTTLDSFKVQMQRLSC